MNYDQRMSVISNWFKTDIVPRFNMPRDVVEAYRMGLKDAMRTNPPSLELEQVCMNMWADRQPVKE